MGVDWFVHAAVVGWMQFVCSGRFDGSIGSFVNSFMSWSDAVSWVDWFVYSCMHSFIGGRMDAVSVQIGGSIDS